MKEYPILLPKTSFPMKARLPQKEPEMVEMWQSQNLYHKMLEKRKSQTDFSMLDGPPYANGAIHIGHALNKILKDIVVKYKNLKGFRAPFVPAWDCHGLPIELEALKSEGDKEISPNELRKICRKTAFHWMEKQRESFKRLGILSDWDKPVLTMDSDYEAEELLAFADLVEKGLIFPGNKPVFWCFKLQTALAFSEAEYRQKESPSIYVKFELSPESIKKLKGSTPSFAVIWTTTPWTLPANTAICLNPDLDYALFSNSKESYVLAVALAETFFKELGLTGFKKQGATFKGKDLEHLEAKHPFLNRKSPFVLGEHVSKDTGTGLVHTAPGHGLEDHLVGQKYKLPQPCPVSASGHFTKDSHPDLEGVFIFKGNNIIIDMLKKSQHLLGLKNIQHSYPYNPRSNSPLIYRLTPQWFLSLDQKPSEVRKKSLQFCEKEIHFVPEWGKARLTSMVETSPDWCLSRQRIWGVPLVVFFCKKCSQSLLDPEIIRHIARQMKKSGQGIAYYFETPVLELLPKNTVCFKCGGKEFKKGEDILDVWFDSGIQHEVFSKIKNFKKPYDLFLEGSDQHRGWFQTSLISSIALDSKSPFKVLMTHGFVNDQKGHKMSKSKGNVLDPHQIIERYGAEILRIWTASENFALDLKAGEEHFKRVVESYRRYRNSFRFILGNLNDFDSSELVAFSNLKPVDQWMLGQLNDLIESSTGAYDSYAFYKVYQQFNHFFTVLLSSFYLDILKDRLYTFQAKSLERKQAQTVLYHLLDHLLVLLAPITSFLSEEAYAHFNKKNKKDSVFLEDFPVACEEWKSPKLKEFFLKVFPLRDELNKELELLRKEGKIGSNLQAKASFTLKKDFISSVLSKEDQLEFFSVSQIEILEGDKKEIKAEIAQGDKCVRCWFISPQLNEDKLCPKCLKNLS